MNNYSLCRLAMALGQIQMRIRYKLRENQAKLGVCENTAASYWLVWYVQKQKSIEILLKYFCPVHTFGYRLFRVC